MTTLVCKPEKAKIVNGRGLYRVHMNGQPIELTIRAANAGKADEVLQFLFKYQTNGKELDFDLDKYKKENGIDVDEAKQEGTGEADPESGGSADADNSTAPNA